MSKIALFDQNWPKFELNLAYWPDARVFDFFVEVWENVKIIFWSLNEVVWDLSNHVRPSVTQSLENRSLLFSEILQLVRACKRDKNVSSAFLKKFRFAHFGQEMSKIGPFGPKCPKMEVFCIFFAIRSLEFPNFLY